MNSPASSTRDEFDGRRIAVKECSAIEVAVASKLSGENVQVGLGEGLMTAPWQVETMRRRVNKLISLHHEGCLVSTESPEMNSIA